jgi:hypothetical protein
VISRRDGVELVGGSVVADGNNIDVVGRNVEDIVGCIVVTTYSEGTTVFDTGVVGTNSFVGRVEVAAAGTDEVGMAVEELSGGRVGSNVVVKGANGPRVERVIVDEVVRNIVGKIVDDPTV